MTEKKKVECPYCKKLLNYDYKKKIHEETNDCRKSRGLDTIQYKCNKCNEIFGCKKNYDRHIFKCSDCIIIKGFIYKIEPNIKLDENDVYYGSTTYKTVKQRYKIHCDNYKKYLNNDEYDYCSCFILFDKYGLNNCNVFELEEINNTSFKIKEKEKEYFDIYPNINIRKPTKSLEDDKKYHENYRKENRDNILKINHNYYENNKEKILQQQKEKRDNMTENERAQYLQHRKETRNAKQEKETKSKLEKCQYCNKEVRHDHINDHYNSNECRLARGEELIIYKCEYCDNEFFSNSMYLKHKYKCNKTQTSTIHTDEKTCIFYKIYNKNNKNEYVVFYTHDDIKKAIRTDRYDYKKYLENKEIKQSKKPNIKCEFIEKNNGIDECEYEIIEEHKYKTTGNIGDDKKYCNNILKKYN